MGVFSNRYIVDYYWTRDLNTVASRAHGILLDVGCGSKPWAGILAHKVVRYVGVDLSPQSAADVIADATHLPLAAESVDCLLCTWVLDDFAEPWNVMDEFCRVLKWGTLSLAASRSWRLHNEPNDYYRFTCQGLRYLVERSGFQAEAVLAEGGLWAMIGTRLAVYLHEYLGRDPVLSLLAASIAGLIQATCLILDRLHTVERDTQNNFLVARKELG